MDQQEDKQKKDRVECGLLYRITLWSFFALFFCGFSSVFISNLSISKGFFNNKNYVDAVTFVIFSSWLVLVFKVFLIKQRKLAKLLSKKIFFNKENKPINTSISAEEELLKLQKRFRDFCVIQDRRKVVFQNILMKKKEEINVLMAKLGETNNRLQASESVLDVFKRKYISVKEEAVKFYKETQEKTANQAAVMSEYQKTILEQRKVIEIKQDHIFSLENRMSDLLKEMREVLQPEKIEEKLAFKKNFLIDGCRDSSAKLATQDLLSYDVSLKLRDYVVKAEKMGDSILASNNFTSGGSSGFEGCQNFFINKRMLFDLLKNETLGAAFVYSAIEKKMLFVNDSLKILLGWTRDKFVHQFYFNILGDINCWEGVLQQATRGKESKVNLELKDKDGRKKKVACRVKMIVKGPFAENFIGIFY